MKKKSLTRPFLRVSFFLLWGGILLLSSSLNNKTAAATLDSLPMGSVIQIKGKDIKMCNDTSSCAGITTTVLPYKLVKMQARDQNGNEVTKTDGTYWMLLDNYCWWGSANCTSLGSKRSYRTTWNGNSSSDCNNNLSVPQTHNILTQLSNFYNSLPNSIAGVSKATALLDHAYDMFSITPTPGTGTTTTGSCPTGWTASTKNINSNSYTFSDSSSCTMTSKIGLPSYTEWQGGLYAYGYYPNITGSSSTYCNARYGVSNCTNNGTYGLFYSDSTSYGQPIHSASNPRPFIPWLRSAVGSSNNAWIARGNASYSVSNYSTFDTAGVVPALWLSSSLNTIGGSGTYESPYVFDICELPENADTFACLPLGTVIQIPSTDTQMCNDEECNTYTDHVLPYKFIKMQARDQNGDPIVNGNNTYWMLGDNYCWWGSAQCSKLGQKSPKSTTWNANSDDDYNNDLSNPKNYNILNQLANFYNSLPSAIGTVSKNDAVVNYAWDMWPIDTDYSSTPALGSCPAGWTASTKTVNSNLFTFSDSAACTMSSKIGLPSYTDWQGGLHGFNMSSTAIGSSITFCQSRWGAIYCYSSYFDQAATALNPNIYYPWTRTPIAFSSEGVWHLDSIVPANYDIASLDYGISPTLWLSSELSSPVCGSGTYADPYRLSEYDCDNAPTLVLDNPTENHFVNIEDDGQGSNQVTFTGSVSDPDNGQEISIKAEFYDDNGNLLFVKNIPFTSDGSFSKTSPLNAELFSLTLTYTELINYGVDSYTNVKFTVSDTIKSTSTLYTGTISLTPLNDLISNLTESLSLRFSGQIYYPNSVATTNMINPGDTYDNYTLLTTLDSNHQIWAKELLAHPNAIATSSTTATPSTQTYPFLVRFYEAPTQLGEIKLN